MYYSAIKRLNIELNNVMKCKETTRYVTNIKCRCDFSELEVEIEGPSETPYESGKFILRIKIPKDYPYGAPSVTFLTKIWHPNISSATGATCLVTEENDNWSPAVGLKGILLTIQMLLSKAEPDDPLDLVVAKQFKNDSKMFELTARHWTKVYAGGSNQNQDFDDKIMQLVKRGLNKDQSLAALSCCNWNLRDVMMYSFFNCSL